MDRILDFIKQILIFSAIIFVLVSCSEHYANKRESAIEAARNEGFTEGYNEGYDRGCRDQYERDIEAMTYDTVSIVDIIDTTVSEYGISPSDAFAILEDRYEYTWEEYQLAQEVAYFVMSQFPWG